MKTETPTRKRRELTFEEQTAGAVARMRRKQAAYIAEQRLRLSECEEDIRLLATHCSQVLADLDRLGGRWDTADDELVLNAARLSRLADEECCLRMAE